MQFVTSLVPFCSRELIRVMPQTLVLFQEIIVKFVACWFTQQSEDSAHCHHVVVLSVMLQTTLWRKKLVSLHDKRCSSPFNVSSVTVKNFTVEKRKSPVIVAAFKMSP